MLYHSIFFIGTILFIVCSISCQIIIGIFYHDMIVASEQFQSAEHKLLRQCKQKFIQCYQMNGTVNNISVFVDKWVNKMKVCKLTIRQMWHLSQQLLLLAMMIAGIGIMTEMKSGKTIFEILPFYIICFTGLYVFFGIATFIDISAKRQMLKINLIDYLENHVAARLKNGMKEKEKLSEEIKKDNSKRQVVDELEKEKITKEEIEELEQLLRLLFTQ